MKKIIFILISFCINNAFAQEKKETYQIIENYKEHYIQRKINQSFLENLKVVLNNFTKNANLYKIKKTKNIAVLNGHTAYIRTLDISNDNKLILSGGDDNILRLWNKKTKKQILKKKLELWSIQSLRFSPDGQYIVFGSLDTKLKLLDIKAKEKRSFHGHEFPIHSVDFSPDGQMIISGSTDKTVKLWNVASGQEIHTFTGYNKAVWKVKFSPDGKQILTASLDGKVKLWDIETKEIIFDTIHDKEACRTIAFSPNGKFIASGGDDNCLKIWDWSKKTLIKTLKGHTNKIWDIIFSLDEKYIFSASLDNTIKLWSLETGQEMFTFKGHKDRVRSIQLSKDGQELISAGDDNQIFVWDLSLWIEKQKIKKDYPKTLLKLTKKSNTIDPISQLAKGNLHLILFVNTNDTMTQKSGNLIIEKITNKFQDISKYSGLSLISTVCSKNYFNKKELDKVLENLKPNPEDVVFFYYLGNGYRNKKQTNKYPKLFVGKNRDKKEEVSIDLKTITNQLNQKKARLNIVIAETCNTEKNINLVLDNISSRNRKISIIAPRKFLDLFAIPKGSVILSTCEPKQISWASQSGSYFVDAFIEALEFQLSKENSDKANWEKLLFDIKSRVINFSGSRNKVQIPQYDNNTY